MPVYGKEKMNKSVAALLVNEHKAEDPEIYEAYWAPCGDEIWLVEVSTSIEDVGEVLPFRFAADLLDVPCPYVVILLSPGDWRRVYAGELELPSGLVREKLERVL